MRKQHAVMAIGKASKQQLKDTAMMPIKNQGMDVLQRAERSAGSTVAIRSLAYVCQIVEMGSRYAPF